MNPVAVVTGAASGIGWALANELLNRGNTVVLAGRRDNVASVAQDLDKGRGRAFAVTVDVRDREAVEEMIEGVYSRHGRLDLLFNNAGISLGGDCEELTWDHWQRLIDVNLRGVVAGVFAAYPRMVARRSGHIINTASLAGLVPSPLLTAYSMTKHAVVGLSLSLRAEAARHGVRVSALCPGLIETPILDSGGPDDLSQTSFADHSREYLTHVMRRNPYPVDKFAKEVVEQVSRNRAVIISPASARVVWWMYRLAPGGFAKLSETGVRWSQVRRKTNRQIFPSTPIVTSSNR